MPENKFKEEQRLFELWLLKQFNIKTDEMLSKTPEFEYKEQMINNLFIGFCGGMVIQKVKGN